MATAEKIKDAVTDIGIVVGGTRVTAVRVQLSEDANGGEIVILKLVLSDPDGDTWPIEDLWQIRRMANEAIRRTDPELKIPWSVSFEPATPDDLDPGDTEHEVQIDL